MGKRTEVNKVNSLFLVDSIVKIYSIADMVKLSLLFLVLLVTTTYAQIGEDGTGTVNGYYIGPGADLTNANLSEIDLSGADLTGVISGNIEGNPILPSGYQMAGGYIVGPGVILTNANLSEIDLSGADLSGADLTLANLSGADLKPATLTGVISGNITGTPTLPLGYEMIRGYIVGPRVNLTNADLSGANLSGSMLNNANLSYANLSGANLSGASLYGADLSGANLSNVDFSAIYDYDWFMTTAIWSNVISQSDYDAVVAERDARPTQAAYDAVVAERDAKLTLDEVKDLRAGSTMIAVENGTATLSMEIEKSSDLSNWTFDRTTTVDIPIEDGVATQFFRFKMADPDTTVTVTVGEDTNDGQPIGVFYFNGAEKAVLEFEKDTTYTFIQNDASNATYGSAHHPLMFSTTYDGEHNEPGHYMTGVVYKLDGVTKTMAEYVSGFVAASDRRIEWTVPSDAPSTLYYWCHFHTGQGAAMTVTD